MFNRLGGRARQERVYRLQGHEGLLTKTQKRRLQRQFNKRVEEEVVAEKEPTRERKDIEVVIMASITEEKC